MSDRDEPSEGDRRARGLADAAASVRALHEAMDARGPAESGAIEASPSAGGTGSPGSPGSTGSSDAKTDVKAAPEAEAEVGSTASPKTEREAQSDAQNEAQSDAQSEAQSDAKREAKASPEVQSEVQSDAQSEAQSDAKRETKTGAKASPEVKLDARTDSEASPEAGPAVQPGSSFGEPRSIGAAAPGRARSAAARGADTDDELDDEAVARALRGGTWRRWAVLGALVVLALGVGASVLLGLRNAGRYALRCTAEQLVATKGRGFPPWGERPLGGKPWKAMSLPLSAECRDRQAGSEAELAGLFAAALMEQAGPVLEAGALDKVEAAAAQLAQAALLVRAPERREQRAQLQRLLGDVEYWRALAKLAQARAALAEAAAQLEAAAKQQPRYATDAAARATRLRQVIEELGSSLPVEAAPAGAAPVAPAGPAASPSASSPASPSGTPSASSTPQVPAGPDAGSARDAGPDAGAAGDAALPAGDAALPAGDAALPAGDAALPAGGVLL